ncbi:MAG: protease modulator HflC [Cellvibrionaceae bacterium]|nr:protease modulator HflC [Cellvibrionaceae bacterium]
MSTKTLFSVVIALLAALVFFSSAYIVNEYEKAVVLRFGKLEIVDPEPGLHFKIPFADEVKKFESRILTLDEKSESFFTVQNEPLEVDSYAKWRILNVGLYYEATGGAEEVANNRLKTRINNGLRNEFGSRTVHEVVSGERDELMQDLIASINKEIADQLGIEVIDIRVKQIELPETVREDVYRRMASGREKEAREYRSKGKEQAEIIRADADRQRAVLEAEARRDAEILRGEGDAKAAAIYAAAYSKDPEFYAFLRRLSAYQSSFGSKEDVMVIAPDSDFFRYLKDSKGQ